MHGIGLPIMRGAGAKSIPTLALCVLALILHLSFLAPHACAQGVITTVAGSGRVFRDDGKPATSAALGEIQSVAVDSAGNVYGADFNNNIVVKVSPSGILTVVAGNGIAAVSGDGGPATSASLKRPSGVAVDAAGNLYIADAGRVRKVSPEGVITTVAGGGSDVVANGVPATTANLAPVGVALDALGNLYIADTFNQRIRKVNPAGTITTVAGTGTRGFSGDGGPATSAQFNNPYGVTVDTAGNLYIADTNNNRVRKVSANGTITTFAGSGAPGFAGDGGPALNASLGGVRSVVADADGRLFLVQGFPYVVRRVDLSGTITTVAGGRAGFGGDGGPATSAALNEPLGIALEAGGNLYIADSGNARIRKVSGGTITTLAGSGLGNFAGDGGPATSALLNQPKGVTIDPGGNMYIADNANHRIRKVSADGVITTLAGTGVPGFSGDGGPAASAQLKEPFGVAADALGNVYIADSSNSRIRKVSPSGIITTVAGGGPDPVANGVPATRASLAAPWGLAIDAAGNLYIADTFFDRIRKVTPAGTISTVAGTGTRGFFGDGGLATAASLNTPYAVAVDAAGNLYIADTTNVRVRQVGSDGIIRTVAGGGTRFPGEGGPATDAALGFPTGVAVDASGNLYFADLGAKRIRQVSGGTITTVAGTGDAGFSGDGGPSTRAMLNDPWGLAVDAAGNLYIGDSRNDRVRRVLATATSFSISPTSLTFSVRAGAPATAQRITVTSPITGLGWTAQASTESGGNWLAVSPASGSAPGTIEARVDAGALAPANYRGRVTVQAPLAVPTTLTVTVELTVGAALPAQLSVEPGSLTFEIPSGTRTPAGQTLRILNSGGASLNWTARAETSSGGNWLSVSAASGSASASSPASLQVVANATGLSPGVYTGSVRVESATTNQTQTVTVTLVVTGTVQTILVSQSGLLFTAVEGGTAVPSQSFGILNTGQGVMNWTVEAGTLSGGNWLAVSPINGRSDAASTQIPEVMVAANLGGLRAGRYSGLIRVVASGANNSPQLVSVDLNVLAPGSNPGVLVRPTGLIFSGEAGVSSPGSQIVRVATAAPGSLDFRAGLLTLDGGDWIQTAPRSAVLSATDPRTITVQPTLETLNPGVYRGALTLLFGDGSTQTVNILFLVLARTAAATSADSDFIGGQAAAQPCAPQRLHAVHRSLGSNFASPVGWPSPVEVQVADDCGHAVTNAAVVASFSNGDPPLALTSLRNGIYLGTWRPVIAADRATVTVRVSLPPLVPVEVQAQGQVSGNPSAPAVNVGGVVNAASFARDAAVAPGAIVSVFGRNLARGQNPATRVPLETILGGATLNVGGVDAPLFFAGTGQINAQLPFELTPNSRPSLAVRTGRDGSAPEAITVPETITIAATQPGIFTMNQQGTGQGAIVDVRGRVVDRNAPAAGGEVVQVFCTGLGVTEPRVRSGQPAPDTEPLARVVMPVEASVGGRPARVLFAGLAPRFVGLYQVNVEIPAGLAPGAEVPLVLIQNGVPSNTVTLAVR